MQRTKGGDLHSGFAMRSPCSLPILLLLTFLQQFAPARAGEAEESDWFAAQKPIGAITTNIDLPRKLAGDLGDEGSVQDRLSVPSVQRQIDSSPSRTSNGMRDFCWAAPATHHQPLYFEQINLERYGYSHFGPLEPIASGVHFLGNSLVLPFKMWRRPPHRSIYTLGHDRPGSCVPYRLHFDTWLVPGWWQVQHASSHAVQSCDRKVRFK